MLLPKNLDKTQLEQLRHLVLIVQYLNMPTAKHANLFINNYKALSKKAKSIIDKYSPLSVADSKSKDTIYYRMLKILELK